MLLLVAGRFKTDVLPIFEELLAFVKNEIVPEEETQQLILCIQKKILWPETPNSLPGTAPSRRVA